MVSVDCLLGEGILTNDILEEVSMIKKFDEKKYREVKISNGNSIVFISKEDENVYQYYKDETVCKNIFFIMNKVNKNKRNKLYFEENVLKYNNFDFIVNLVSYIPNNVIVWKKVFCLNMLEGKELSSFILKNIKKLVWDISKALNTLHNLNIYHGDCRIDNIGIYNGNFILFDFDGSKISNTKEYTLMEKDVYDFISSIRFNVGDEFKLIRDLFPNSYYSSYYLMSFLLINIKGEKIDKKINLLENMCIVV